MREIHQYLGLAIAGIFLLLALWGMIQWIRNTDPGPLYYRLLAVAQVGLGLQLIVGVIMFLVVREGESIRSTSSTAAFRSWCSLLPTSTRKSSRGSSGWPSPWPGCSSSACSFGAT